MYIEHDKGKSVLQAAKKRTKRKTAEKGEKKKLNIYKFYVANVLYRVARFPFYFMLLCVYMIVWPSI